MLGLKLLGLLMICLNFLFEDCRKLIWLFFLGRVLVNDKSERSPLPTLLCLLQLAIEFRNTVGLIVCRACIRLSLGIYALRQCSVWVVCIVESNFKLLQLFHFRLKVHRPHLLVKSAQLLVGYLEFIANLDFVSEPLRDLAAIGRVCVPLIKQQDSAKVLNVPDNSADRLVD